MISSWISRLAQTSSAGDRHGLRSMARENQEATHGRPASAAGAVPSEPGWPRSRAATAEPGRVREPSQAEECIDRGFLNDVLCVLACTYQSPAQPPHTRLPPQQQPPERVAVAGQHRPDQLGIIARIVVVHHTFCCIRQTNRHDAHMDACVRHHHMMGHTRAPGASRRRQQLSGLPRSEGGTDQSTSGTHELYNPSRPPRSLPRPT
jgi:hypothetical protein